MPLHIVLFSVYLDEFYYSSINADNEQGIFPKSL